MAKEPAGALRRHGDPLAERGFAVSGWRVDLRKRELRHLNAHGDTHERWRGGLAFARRGDDAFDPGRRDDSRCAPTHICLPERVGFTKSGFGKFALEVCLSLQLQHCLW